MRLHSISCYDNYKIHNLDMYSKSIPHLSFYFRPYQLLQCRNIEKVIGRCHSWNLEMLRQQISAGRLWSCLGWQNKWRKTIVCNYSQMNSLHKDLVSQQLVFLRASLLLFWQHTQYDGKTQEVIILWGQWMTWKDKLLTPYIGKVNIQSKFVKHAEKTVSE